MSASELVSEGRRRLQQLALLSQYLLLGTLGMETPWTTNGDSFSPSAD